MRRQPNIFEALDGLSDEEKQRIVYGTASDRREGLIAGVALALFYGLILYGLITSFA